MWKKVKCYHCHGTGMVETFSHPVTDLEWISFGIVFSFLGGWIGEFIPRPATSPGRYMVIGMLLGTATGYYLYQHFYGRKKK